LKKNEEWVSIDADAAPISIDDASIEFAELMHGEVLGCWKAHASESKLQSFYPVPNDRQGQNYAADMFGEKPHLKFFLMGSSLPRLGFYSFL
jgi:hypothetical protein